MVQIKLKRVYEDPEQTDGFRVFVDRLWPRGMKKESFKFDLWEKDITPSPELRKWFHQDQESNWSRFAELYKKELETSEALGQFVKIIVEKKVVTLLYASKNREQNHAIIVKEVLEEKSGKSGKEKK